MDPMSPSASSESIASEFELLRLPPRVLALPSSASTTMTHSCLNAHRFYIVMHRILGFSTPPVTITHLTVQPFTCSPAIAALLLAPLTPVDHLSAAFFLAGFGPRIHGTNHRCRRDE